MTYLIDPQPDVFQEREIREISPIHDKKTTPVDDSSTSSSSLLDQSKNIFLYTNCKPLVCVGSLNVYTSPTKFLLLIKILYCFYILKCISQKIFHLFLSRFRQIPNKNISIQFSNLCVCMIFIMC